MAGGFVDDEDYPLISWCADYDLGPNPRCSQCAGDGVTDDRQPCRCLVVAIVEAFPVEAEAAFPDPLCPWCDGDGETWEGQLCACLVTQLRALVDYPASSDPT